MFTLQYNHSLFLACTTTSGRLWATPVASFRDRLLDFRSCWIVFIHVVWRCPSSLVELSTGAAVNIFLASVLPGVCTRWLNRKKRRAWKTPIAVGTHDKVKYSEILLEYQPIWQREKPVIGAHRIWSGKVVASHDLHVGLLKQGDPHLTAVVGVWTEKVAMLVHWQIIIDDDLTYTVYTRSSRSAL